jgi:hypothetical protein
MIGMDLEGCHATSRTDLNRNHVEEFPTLVLAGSDLTNE